MDMLFSFITNQALYLSFVRGDATPVADALRSLPPIPSAGPVGELHQEPRRGVARQADRRGARGGLRGLRAEEVDAAVRPGHPATLPVDGRRRSAAHGARLQPRCSACPGTPVLFYGEEIGLGDNLAMADREAVRLPMQWSDRPGGGFTTADEIVAAATGACRRPVRLPRAQRARSSAATRLVPELDRARHPHPQGVAGVRLGRRGRCSGRAIPPSSPTSPPGTARACSRSTTSPTSRAR